MHVHSSGDVVPTTVAAAHESSGKALDAGNVKQIASTHHLNANRSELAVWLCAQTAITHSPEDPILTSES